MRARNDIWHSVKRLLSWRHLLCRRPYSPPLDNTQVLGEGDAPRCGINAQTIPKAIVTTNGIIDSISIYTDQRHQNGNKKHYKLRAQ